MTTQYRIKQVLDGWVVQENYNSESINWGRWYNMKYFPMLWMAKLYLWNFIRKEKKLARRMNDLDNNPIVFTYDQDGNRIES